MSWLQLELRATPDTLEAIESVLLACGSVSITLVSDADEPVLEPAPGETPLWSSVRMQALFPLETDMRRLRDAIRALDGNAVEHLQVEFVNAQDWQEAARTYAVDCVFANRLWLLPKDLQVSEPASDLTLLRLDPGLAFGSGSHPTTRLCLQWIAAHVVPGMRILDFGCGSGVLGIAAALLGAHVVAVDHDDQAVMATTENAAYNGLSVDNIQVMSLEQWQSLAEKPVFDAIVANILAGPLQSLAAEFERIVAPGGDIVLSGVLAEQAADVMAAYTQTNFLHPEIEAGWACLQGQLQGQPAASH